MVQLTCLCLQLAVNPLSDKPEPLHRKYRFGLMKDATTQSNSKSLPLAIPLDSFMFSFRQFAWTQGGE